jgi:hypothetical protein
MKLEQIQTHAALRGIIPDTLVSVVSVQWFGSEALELTYKTAAGKVANELLYRHDEPRLELVEQGRPWSFDGDGALFRLVSEASASGLRISSTRYWRCIPRLSIRCRTRSPRSMKRCCLASRCAFSWRTIPAPARRSWPAC